jgi:ATP-dependent helicase HrpB
VSSSKKQTLPIDQYMPEIIESLKHHSSLVLSAEPGAGKTTRLPPAILQSLGPSIIKKVLVLEPRRIAAIAAAHRIAEENHWTVGAEVGYQVRFESQMTAKTSLIFLTEALLAKKIQNDPNLEDVGAVIIDEFHERSQHVDLALGLLKELQTLSRPDLKIVVMSATLNHQPLCEFLETTNYFSVPGKTFPLQIEYLNSPLRLQTDSVFIEQVLNQIKLTVKTLASGEHLLVFLPGLGEIERIQREIESTSLASHFLIYALHGNLPIAEQKLILQPSSKSKIILSTNVAESSLTIDGVTQVIDSGLQRRSTFDSRNGVSSLQLTKISQSSATQRSGRAARQKPGRCLRLWSKLDQQGLPIDDVAEIHRSDLSDAILILAQLGITDPLQFSWLESPQMDRLKMAFQQLKILKAIDPQGKLTPRGRRLSQWPLSPRLSTLMEEVLEQASTNPRALEIGCSIAAALSEPRFFRQMKHSTSASECDITEWLPLVPKSPLVSKVYRQLLNLCEKKRAEKNSLSIQEKTISQSDEDFIKKILLQSFPDRLARRRKSVGQQELSQKALLMGGRGLVLDDNSSVKKSEYFIALEVFDSPGGAGDCKASLASGIREEWLQDLGKIESYERVDFDEDKKKFFKISGRRLFLDESLFLPLGHEHSQAASKDLIQQQLSEVAKEHWDYFVRMNSHLEKWQKRLDFFQKYLGQDLLSEQNKKEALAEASYGEHSLEDVAKKDLIYFLQSKMSPQDLVDFESHCPVFFIAPTGSKIPINYDSEKPVLEIRLQELFGQSSAPTICQGQCPLTIHLLAPNYRPVQVTQDLMSFWKNGYLEVKKELKSRYPKHSWPDDPLKAPPIAKGRPRH